MFRWAYLHGTSDHSSDGSIFQDDSFQGHLYCPCPWEGSSRVGERDILERYLRCFVKCCFICDVAWLKGITSHDSTWNGPQIRQIRLHNHFRWSSKKYVKQNQTVMINTTALVCFGLCHMSIHYRWMACHSSGGVIPKITPLEDSIHVANHLLFVAKRQRLSSFY